MQHQELTWFERRGVGAAFLFLEYRHFAQECAGPQDREHRSLPSADHALILIRPFMTVIMLCPGSPWRKITSLAPYRSIEPCHIPPGVILRFPEVN